MKIEKRPGWDWIVTYTMFDDPPEEMDVFGAMTIEEAIRDARSSLSSGPLGDENEYDILKVERRTANWMKN